MEHKRWDILCLCFYEVISTQQESCNFAEYISTKKSPPPLKKFSEIRIVSDSYMLKLVLPAFDLLVLKGHKK